LFRPQTYLDVTDSYYTNDQFVKWTVSKTSFEFIPRGVATKIEPPLDITQIDLEKNQLALEPLTLVGGEAYLNLTTNLPHYKQASVTSDQGAAIQFNTFNFPGWQATIDGKTKTINDDNPLKLIRLTIPPGSHTITLSFTNTPVRTLANSLSLLSLIALTITGLAKPITKHIFPRGH
jgi:hypothetical protein